MAKGKEKGLRREENSGERERRVRWGKGKSQEGWGLLGKGDMEG